MRYELQELYAAYFKGLRFNFVQAHYNEFQVTINEDGNKGWLTRTVFGLTPEGIGPPLFISRIVRWSE
jgi:hypothetical protein